MDDARSVAIGIDVGGSGIKAAAVDTARGTLVSDRIRVPTPQPSTPATIIPAIVRMVRRIETVVGASDIPIGVDFPSVVLDGKTMSAANVDPEWVGYPAAEQLERALGRPVTVVNDADAAGLAEVRFGAGAGRRGVVLVLTLGTGVGSGLFVDGILVPNSELGHMEIRGRDAERRSAAVARVRRGISWKAWTADLDEHLQAIDRILWPDLIVLGGGVSKNADRFIPRLTCRPPVVPAVLRNEAGMVGAALFAVEERAAAGTGATVGVVEADGPAPDTGVRAAEAEEVVGAVAFEPEPDVTAAVEPESGVASGPGSEPEVDVAADGPAPDTDVRAADAEEVVEAVALEPEPDVTAAVEPESGVASGPGPEPEVDVEADGPAPDTDVRAADAEEVVEAVALEPEPDVTAAVEPESGVASGPGSEPEIDVAAVVEPGVASGPGSEPEVEEPDPAASAELSAADGALRIADRWTRVPEWPSEPGLPSRRVTGAVPEPEGSPVARSPEDESVATHEPAPVATHEPAPVAGSVLAVGRSEAPTPEPPEAPAGEQDAAPAGEQDAAPAAEQDAAPAAADAGQPATIASEGEDVPAPAGPAEGETPVVTEDADDDHQPNWWTRANPFRS